MLCLSGPTTVLVQKVMIFKCENLENNDLAIMTSGKKNYKNIPIYIKDAITFQPLCIIPLMIATAKWLVFVNFKINKNINIAF